MKKILSLLVFVIALTSCEDDATFNNPSVQGKKDNVFWRATSSEAKVVGGALTIYAYTPFEILTLTTSSTAPGTYYLGGSAENTATYTFDVDGVQTSYSTGIDFGDGQIIINPTQTPGTITGTFKFNASKDGDPLEEILLNYNQGVFYQVPIQ